MAAGLREGWDGPRARRWYDAATDIGERAPEVLRAVETGRESTRFNLRHRLRPVRIDWDGYVETVEAVRRARWQVAGIARTLVGAADEADLQPAPSADWLECYARVLDEIREALDHFGVWSTEAERAVETHVGRALEALEELGEQIRQTPSTTLAPGLHTAPSCSTPNGSRVSCGRATPRRRCRRTPGHCGHPRR